MLPVKVRSKTSTQALGLVLQVIFGPFLSYCNRSKHSPL